MWVDSYFTLSWYHQRLFHHSFPTAQLNVNRWTRRGTVQIGKVKLYDCQQTSDERSENVTESVEKAPRQWEPGLQISNNWRTRGAAIANTCITCSLRLWAFISSNTRVLFVLWASIESKASQTNKDFHSLFLFADIAEMRFACQDFFLKSAHMMRLLSEKAWTLALSFFWKCFCIKATNVWGRIVRK